MNKFITANMPTTGLQRHQIYQGIAVAVASGIGICAFYKSHIILDFLHNHSKSLFDRTAAIYENTSLVATSLFNYDSKVDDQALVSFIDKSLLNEIHPIANYCIKIGLTIFIARYRQVFISIYYSLKKEMNAILKPVIDCFENLISAIDQVRNYNFRNTINKVFDEIKVRSLECVINLADNVKTYCQTKLNSIRPTIPTPKTLLEKIWDFFKYCINIAIITAAHYFFQLTCLIRNTGQTIQDKLGSFMKFC